MEHIAEAMGKGSKSDRMRTRPVRSRSSLVCRLPSALYVHESCMALLSEQSVQSARRCPVV